MNKKLQSSIFDIFYERLKLLQQSNPEEYETDEDVCETFNAIAEEAEISMVEVLKVLEAKHTILFRNAEKDIYTVKNLNHDYLLEKFGDFVNYQIIFF